MTNNEGKRRFLIRLQPGDRIGNYVILTDEADALYAKAVDYDHTFHLSEVVMEVEKVQPPAEDKRPSQISEDKRPSQISFYRYVRPLSDQYEIDNLRGTTFLFNLDYERRRIEFSWACVEGENFNKEMGRALAADRMANREKICLPMQPNGIGADGAVTEVAHRAFDRLPRVVRKQMYGAGVL